MTFLHIADVPHMTDETNNLRAQIAACVRRCATKPYKKTDESDGVPLFSKAGIADSPTLQDEIVRVASEYVNMVLFKDYLNSDECTLPEPDKVKFIALANKEMTLWTARTIEILKTYPDQMKAYCNTTSPPDIPPVINGIIALACAAKEKINDIPKKAGDIPGRTRHRFAVNNYLLATDSKKASLALSILDDHMKALRESDRRPSR